MAIGKTKKITSSKDNTHCRYFDDLISWKSYQTLIKLLVFFRKAESNDSNAKTDCLIKALSAQRKYRKTQGYQTPATVRQQEKFNYHLLTIKAALGAPHVLKEQYMQLGRISKKMITGTSTATAVLIIYTLLYLNSADLSEITLPVIAATAIIYGFRDIFKEGIHKRLTAFFRQHRFQWRRKVYQSVTNRHLLTQAFKALWRQPEYFRHCGNTVTDIVQQHHILHYDCKSKVKKKTLPVGFDGFYETLTLDLSTIHTSLFSNSKRVFLTRKNGKIHEYTRLPRSIYLITMITGEKNKSRSQQQEHIYKITLTKDRITRICEVPQKTAAIQNEKRFFSKQSQIFPKSAESYEVGLG